jgi:hypothetical protein
MVLNVGHKAVVVALLPEPETLVDTFLDVSGSTDSCSALQNDQYEDDCLLGIAFALPNGTEEFRQRGQEALANALRGGVQCWGNTGQVTPVFLEELVVRDPSVEVSSGIIVKMIPEHLLQQLVGFGRNIVRQIGTNLWGKERGLGVPGVVERVDAADGGHRRQ